MNRLIRFSNLNVNQFLILGESPTTSEDEKFSGTDSDDDGEDLKDGKRKFLVLISVTERKTNE